MCGKQGRRQAQNFCPRRDGTNARYGLRMDILAYLLLSAIPVAAGYFVIRLAVRHGVMDAHQRMQQSDGGPPNRFKP